MWYKQNSLKLELVNDTHHFFYLQQKKTQFFICLSLILIVEVFLSNDQRFKDVYTTTPNLVFNFQKIQFFIECSKILHVELYIVIYIS